MNNSLIKELADSYHIALTSLSRKYDEETFGVFVQGIYETLRSERIFGILVERIDEDNPVAVEQCSADADQLGFWLAGMVVVARGHLRLMKRAMLMQPPLGSKWTNMDREIHLEATCNIAIMLVELLQNLREHTFSRISLCQSLLRQAEKDLRQVTMRG